MTEVNLDYYRRRAMTERLMSVSADNAEVAAIHHELATRYQRLIDEAHGREASAAFTSPTLRRA